MNTRTPWPYSLALPPAAPATPAARSISDEFLRGCITSGLLAALQNPGLKPRLDAHTLRLSLQGGAALAAGTAAIQSMRQGRPGRALFSVAAGVAAVAAAQHLLAPACAVPEISEISEISETTQLP